MKSIIVFLMLGISVSSFAGIRVSQQDAERAVAYIEANNIKEVIIWCSCCANAPMKKLALQKASFRFAGMMPFYEVVVEGKTVNGDSISEAVDLSDVWIPSGKMAKDLASILSLKANACFETFEFKVADDPQYYSPSSSELEDTSGNSSFIYIQGSRMPEPLFDINQYLISVLRYPDYAKDHNIRGRVVVKFIINEEGYIEDAKIVTGIGGGCDEEALRVIENMPRWKPGWLNGRRVKISYSQPINFSVEPTVYK